MRNIHVFIASSSELKMERLELVDLLNDLSDEYESHNIKFIPIKWEYLDSSMRATRKEDDYLKELADSEVCITMFWNMLGEYTKEELLYAINEKANVKNLKVIGVYFKEPTSNITQELLLFKLQLKNAYKNIKLFSFSSIQELRMQVTLLLKEYLSAYH